AQGGRPLEPRCACGASAPGQRRECCRQSVDSPDVIGHRPATPADRTQLAPQYAPAQVETRRYEGWIDAGYFTPDADGDGPAYTIVIPPPNVTGSLHIGHALDHT